MTDYPIQMDRILAQLEESIRQAADQYFRLVILAGDPGSGKTAILHGLSRRLGYKIVNVNLELSKGMLELTRAQRPRHAERLLRRVLTNVPGEVILLDNLEILFDTALQIEPLRLLQLLSRNRTLVVSWSGTFCDSTLTYAEPGHPEFVQFKQLDAIVLALGRSAAI